MTALQNTQTKSSQKPALPLGLARLVNISCEPSRGFLTVAQGGGHHKQEVGGSKGRGVISCHMSSRLWPLIGHTRVKAYLIHLGMGLSKGSCAVQTPAGKDSTHWSQLLPHQTCSTVRPEGRNTPLENCQSENSENSSHGSL